MTMSDALLVGVVVELAVICWTLLAILGKIELLNILGRADKP